MIIFQERFFQALDSSLNVKCTCLVHFPEDGGVTRVVAATDNKLTWPECGGMGGQGEESEDERCSIYLREVPLPYNSEDFSVTGLHNILMQQQNFLYVTLTPREDDEERCHILCFALQYCQETNNNECDDERYELVLQQDLSCGYCPLDMQHIQQQQQHGEKDKEAMEDEEEEKEGVGAGVEGVEDVIMLTVGSDQRLHQHIVDPVTGRLLRMRRSTTSIDTSSGTGTEDAHGSTSFPPSAHSHSHSHLHSHLQRELDWSQRLLSQHSAPAASASPLPAPSQSQSQSQSQSSSSQGGPLRVLCERWRGSGSSSSSGRGGGTQGLVGHVDGLLCWDRQADQTRIPAGREGGESLVEGCQHQHQQLVQDEKEEQEEEKKKNKEEERSEDEGQPASTTSTSTRIRQLRHHSVSSDESRIRTLSAVAEEDEEEDSSSSGGSEEPNQLQVVASSSASSIEVLRSAAAREMQRLLTAAAAAHSDSHDDDNDDDDDDDDNPISSSGGDGGSGGEGGGGDCKKVLLLDGCVSCLQFYNPQSKASRVFHRRHSPSSTTDSGGSDVSVNGGSGGNRSRDAFTPSPSVLVGLSGTVALLTLCPDEEGGAHVQSLLLPPRPVPSAAPPLAPAPPPPPAAVTSTSPAPSPSTSSPHGVVMALCVGDVTGDNCNEILVGYEDGCIRVVAPPPPTPAATAAAAGVEGRGHSSSRGHVMGSTGFVEIAHMQVPFPVVSMEFGHLLGGKGGWEGCWCDHPEGGEGQEGVVFLHPQLVVHTTQSVHVYTIQPHNKSSGEQRRGEKEALVRNILRNFNALFSAPSSF